MALSFIGFGRRMMLALVLFNICSTSGRADQMPVVETDTNCSKEEMLMSLRSTTCSHDLDCACPCTGQLISVKGSYCRTGQCKCCVRVVDKPVNPREQHAKRICRTHGGTAGALPYIWPCSQLRKDPK